MEECKICYDIIDQKQFKKMSCGHTICDKCYLNLIICECPFCRCKISYSKKEQQIRENMGVDTNADFSDNIVFNPSDYIYGQNINNNINNNRNNLSSTTFREPGTNIQSYDDYEDPNYIISRTNRRRHRRLIQEYSSDNYQNTNANDRRRKRSRRRRKLSDEEIKHKREIIKKKKKFSRMKKHGRLMKEIAWYNLQID